MAVGTQALLANTTGLQNVSIGSGSLVLCTTGSENTAIGQEALDSVTTGDMNIGIGEKGGYTITTGNTNIAIGVQAARNLTTGSNNVFVGVDAIPTTNSISNNVVLGNSSTSVLRCQVQTINSLSDERDKTDIIDSIYGLDIINSIRARQFKWAIREDPDAVYPISKNNGKVELGFIAQELNTALGDKNDIIRMVDNTNPDKLDASYGRLIPILVKAVQELSTKNTTLETRVATLEAA